MDAERIHHTTRSGLAYRTVSFKPDTFDALKKWQRVLSAEAGRRLTNGETLDALLRTIPAPPSGH